MALFSFLLAGLTLLSFCIGFVPIPLTAWVCYPAAVLLGVSSMLTGFGALGRVRASGEKGRGLALVGVWAGVLTILVVLVFTTITFLLIYYGAGAINTLWSQIFH